MHRPLAALDQPQRYLFHHSPLGTHIAFEVAEDGVTQEIQQLQMFQNSQKHLSDDGDALLDV